MQVKGKIIAELQPKTGTSAKGEWTVKPYVLCTEGEHSKKVCFEVFGADRIIEFNLRVGDEVTVHLDIDAREYNGKWYNQVRAWKVER